MTTLRNGDLAFECDECGQLDEGHDPDDYHGAWGMLKENGWRAFQKNGKWQHGCPDCVRAFAREQSGVDKRRDEIGRQRRDWMAQRRKGAGDVPREAQRRNEPAPPPRRRSNDRPPWE